jgi:aminoglycoside phosphotransferase family enzyme
LVETHSSVFVFFGDRVYEAKEPVDLGFLDFRSRAQRQRACEEEVRLNRRLARDVSGSADLEHRGAGEAVGGEVS